MEIINSCNTGAGLLTQDTVIETWRDRLTGLPERQYASTVWYDDMLKILDVMLSGQPHGHNTEYEREGKPGPDMKVLVREARRHSRKGRDNLEKYLEQQRSHIESMFRYLWDVGVGRGGRNEVALRLAENADVQVFDLDSCKSARPKVTV